jgi:hypothetical protein
MAAARDVAQGPLFAQCVDMPQSHTDRFHTNHNRDKREAELLAYDHASLESVYKVACESPRDALTEMVPAEAMVAAILEYEFGPLD